MKPDRYEFVSQPREKVRHLDFDPRWMRTQREERRASGGASTMLGTLMIMFAFVAGGLVFAVVERFLTR